MNEPPIPSTPATQKELETSRKTLEQRHINLVWEFTQAFVAISVTLATLYVAANLALRAEALAAAFLLLSNAFFLVIGFYFGRTNHERTGGAGSKDDDIR
jgi:hypothetical protein